ncbi:MAG: hypothetical protein DRH49_07595 [Candidatus Coatesbacteria bacterium]|nr:MAG: hypothetical protein DRH49_07595 [Candidatus Coatesbacteria bacterium]
MPASARHNLSLNLFILYNIILIPILIFILISTIFVKKMRAGFLMRILPTTINLDDECVLIHSSSLGEARMATYLADIIKKLSPTCSIIGSSFTIDGLNVIKESSLFSHTMLYPLDFYPLVAYKLRRSRPHTIVLLESDLWPSLIYWGKRKGARIVIFSGRLTKKAVRLMGAFKMIVTQLYQNVDRIYAVNNEERNRLIDIGVNRSIIEVSGSMKYIKEPKKPPKRDIKRLRGMLGIKEEDIVITAGSTHSGEEEIILGIFMNLKRTYKDIKLIIAPRYIERSDEIKGFSQNSNFVTAKYSDNNIIRQDWDVMIVDRIGLLSDLYSISRVAFVGGSFVNRGGQNIMEPARYGVPVAFGPNITNFRYEADMLLSNNGGRMIRNTSELGIFLKEIIDNDHLHKRYSEGALKTYKSLVFNKSVIINEIKEWL